MHVPRHDAQAMLPKPALALSQVWELCKPQILARESTPEEFERSQRAFCAGATAVLSVLLATAARGDQTRDVRRALGDLVRALGAHRPPEPLLLHGHTKEAWRSPLG